MSVFLPVQWEVQLHMVLWSASSSHYFPILTAGKSKIDLKVPPPICSFTASSFHFLLPPQSVCLHLISLNQSPLTPLNPPPCAIFRPNHLLDSLCGLLPRSSSNSFTLCPFFSCFPPALHPSPSVLLYSLTPWSDLPPWGLCVTDECYEWARGRWDDERACGHSCASGSF